MTLFPRWELGDNDHQTKQYTHTQTPTPPQTIVGGYYYITIIIITI